MRGACACAGVDLERAITGGILDVGYVGYVVIVGTDSVLAPELDGGIL